MFTVSWKPNGGTWEEQEGPIAFQAGPEGMVTVSLEGKVTLPLACEVTLRKRIGSGGFKKVAVFLGVSSFVLFVADLIVSVSLPSGRLVIKTTGGDDEQVYF